MSVFVSLLNFQNDSIIFGRDIFGRKSLCGRLHKRGSGDLEIEIATGFLNERVHSTIQRICMHFNFSVQTVLNSLLVLSTYSMACLTFVTLKRVFSSSLIMYLQLH